MLAATEAEWPARNGAMFHFGLGFSLVDSLQVSRYSDRSRPQLTIRLCTRSHFPLGDARYLAPRSLRPLGVGMRSGSELRR